MTKKILLINSIFFALASGVVAIVFSLFLYQKNQPPKADDTGSTRQGIQEVVDSNNKFAFDLYSQLNKSGRGNIFYSPYSLFAALAMTYEGAKGRTADEMKSVFHFPENNILRTNFVASYNNINEMAKDYELKTVNALWLQKDFLLLSNYTNKIEKYYSGKGTNLDFVKETERSRQTINGYIKKKTNNKIIDLIPKGYLNIWTRLVLTNAIYFKGTWQWEFNTSDTNNEDFKITPEKSVKAPMMNMKPKKANFNYGDTGDLQILELPYKGDKISMLIILPTKDLGSIESSLTVKKLQEYKSKMNKTKLDLISLPKFEFNTKYFMNETFKALGMPTAFSNNADFSRMSEKKDLSIAFVIHQACIKVDEKGTESASATAVGMEKIKMFVSRNVFKANHPFIFLIQEKETGNILFLGKVVDPTR